MNSDRKLVIILGIIAIIFEIPLFWVTKDISYFWKIFTIVVTAFFVIGVLFWDRITKTIIIRSPIVLHERKMEKSTIVEVFSKNELPRLETLVDKASSEIYFLGLTLESLRQIIPNIETALRNNRKIRVLLLEPKTELLARIESLVATSNIDEGISRTIHSLLVLSNAQPPLTREQKDNLQIRTHDQIPTHSLVVVDPYIESSKYMQLEPYAFGITSGERKVFIITGVGKKQQEVFNTFLKGYNQLWEIGKRVID